MSTIFRAPLARAFLPVPQSSPVTVATYAGDCTTPKTLFNLQDTDLTVCAKVTGGQPSWRIIWSNANSIAVQDVPVGTGESTFTLTPSSSLGDWRVILFEPFGGSVQQVTSFTVVDAANPSADLSISKNVISDSVSTGGQILFSVQVTNRGPSSAAAVQLSDTVPANTTFASFDRVAGPTDFDCINPTAGSSSGNTVCSIADLAAGETATFLASYDVTGGVGTIIFNTASVTSSTADPREISNSSTADIKVTAGTSETCELDCPANVVVTANATSGGESGAFVTYGAASGTGNCGAISNSPQSGSFFTVGTHPVNSNADAGQSCSFTVTVIDSTPPTISCPANILVDAPEGSNEATLDPAPGTTPATTPTVTFSGSATVTGVRSDGTPATYDQDGNVITPAVVIPLNAPYPVGTTGILWTVKDAGGRTKSCSQTITVHAVTRDTLTITCPGNINVTAPSGSCQNATVNVGNPTTHPSDSHVTVRGVRSDGESMYDCDQNGDNCTRKTSDLPFPAGDTVITWTATDDVNDSVASCTQIVHVTGTDNQAPTLHVPGPVSVTTSSCSATLDDELGVATAEDNCTPSVNVVRSGVPANFVFPTGTTTITYTATDAAGNTATGTQSVTVHESTPPTINAPASLLTLNTGGAGGAFCGTFVGDATLGTATANDNCPGVTVARTGVPAGNNFPVGDTVVTYTATDRAGNIAQALQTIRVADNTPPVISCPTNMVVNLPLNSTATSMVVNYTAPVGTDYCSGATTTQTAGLASGAVFPVGNTTNTFRVTDAAGNFTECSFTVTVLFNFTGFFSPVGNVPTLNSVNAGRAIPVKFSLSGNKGLDIFAVNNPYSVSFNCNTNDPGVDVTETTTAGGSSLTYSPDQYHYVWKTESSWAGTCRQLVITLNDGSVHTANFRFK